MLKMCCFCNVGIHAVSFLIVFGKHVEITELEGSYEKKYNKKKIHFRYINILDYDGPKNLKYYECICHFFKIHVHTNGDCCMIVVAGNGRLLFSGS